MAGGTGFVGRELVRVLAERGCHLSILTRKNIRSSLGQVQYYEWNVMQEEIDISAFDNVDTIINLTGANIGEKRWRPKRKKEILESRVNAVRLLYKYVVENKVPITTFISSSAVGYYGAVSYDTILNEASPNGNDFLGKVCRAWEMSAQVFSEINSRVVILRKGIVLGNGGVYGKMAPLAKCGINTALGNGKQYMPWIDIDDLIGMYIFFLENQSLGGVFNAVATEHISMNDFAKNLLYSFDRNTILPNVPAFLVKIMFGEMASMLLEGTRVGNEKIKDAGFQFKNESLLETLQKIKASGPKVALPTI
ncbi:MAG: TIGR01777 family oxidoreductase [Edaphocola sp.]